MRLLRLAPVALVLLALVAAPAAARTVRYGGEAVRVPAGWPVIRLAEHPRLCVRLDRRAVYLGRPGAAQRCPSHAIGGRRAILVEPRPRARPLAAASAIGPPVAAASPSSDAFTGLGFDACAAPSKQAMRSWLSSPYRAVGVYIGGANRACSQPNLTPAWVAEQVAAGWHLIPTYVGLQAPTSACGSCAKLSAAGATKQGAEAAADAVGDAQAIGMGPGSPIYFDMEAYTRTTKATQATLAFLASWTNRLHALGYQSGVYSSSASGIADLAREHGSGYLEPDHIWFANWNNRRNALDPYLSPEMWPLHQRIHQYRGGHNETYGLVTINIDNDYVDAATVGAASAPPSLSVRHVRARSRTVKLWVRCGEDCLGHLVLRSGGLGIGWRAFELGGGNSHTFRFALNQRGRGLLARKGSLKAKLLVAIAGSRVTHPVQLSRRR
jgi:hypothetical protein